MSNRQTVSDEAIYGAIYDAIIENRIAPGTKLSQDELCEVFGVSKSRIRPILFRLAEQRIIRFEVNRGAFVESPKIEEVRAVLEARIILEEGIVRLLMKQHNNIDLTELKRIAEEERDALVNQQTAIAHRLSGQFHICMAEMTGNPVLSELSRSLVSRNALGVAAYQKKIGSCALHGHAAIIDAINSKDEELAVNTALEHLREIAASLDPAVPLKGRQRLKAAFGALS